ncbi:MAG TPA: DUF2723 domain-containing protein [Bacteroidales bacterium]|nr:DUF2723 domain-containing protein [Bacteroidales bacterium]
MMKKYALINNITGWVIFAIAAIVYLLTMEPTASFWDPGEFIATAMKQQIGHPPGAPFFMIMGRFFTLLAGQNLSKVAVCMNSMSALASAFTILFLFWSITHLARKILIKEEKDLSVGNMIAIMAAGIVGALAYTFSDSFWFSAVEAEVYATSTLFTALVFWLMLKWEEAADKPHANRWLILIAFLMGLSIGVHLLNLLAIPALVFIYYFKKYKVTRWGIVKALGVSVLILGAILYVIIPGIPWLASVFELIFVNGFGLPFNSGLIFYVVLLSALTIWLVWLTYRKKMVGLNTILTGVAVILLGYFSYGMIVIRSAANPPLNENNPSNVFSLLSYLNRDQYGDRPLFKGQYYNAPLVESKQGKAIYTPIGRKYVKTSYKPVYVYDERFTTIFPRMYSDDPRHIEAYKHWAGIKGKPVRITGNDGKTKTEYVPTFGENLKFFWRYQLGWMYFRYFMWNFAGRQNDIQGNDGSVVGEGNKLYGNWISGIKFLDEARLGPQDNLPSTLAKNRGRNTYYLLPLLLGLVGLVYHYLRNPKDTVVVFWLFFMTGIAIVLYLNQKPLEPRERDYSYAGSFYAFAIWIGLGVLALYEQLRKFLPSVAGASVSLALCTLAVPVIMAEENWDDHDRSGRYTARDFAINYLQSCDSNAVVFTNGDNDTFPLWYVQEVEGIRTDVRVVNLSYLGADWYIDQMKRKVYDSDPLPIQFTSDQFRQGRRDIIYIVERTQDKLPLKEALYDWLGSDDPRTKSIPGYQGRFDYLPAKNYTLAVDTNAVRNSGILTKRELPSMVSSVDIKIDKNYITKSDMLVLDMLATSNWKRPLYFAVTVSRDNWLGLDPYLRLEGLAYRILPVRGSTDIARPGTVAADIMYDNMMNKFRWGGIDNPHVYLDENNQRMLLNMRNNFARLAEALLAEGKNDSARKVLDRCMELLPSSRVPHNFFSLPLIEMFYRTNQPDKAGSIVTDLLKTLSDELHYYYHLNQKFPNEADYERRLDFYLMSQLDALTKKYDQKELNKKIQDELKTVSLLYGIPAE